ncbi:hypothetical protein R1sor_015410 [Riccia sorocarpa]|uniref:Uncharacterized protein n=1 Tax=Riccia sorocarpa TaxID=122646 RepID=A0ABD3HDZ2_9MARC
MRNILSRLLGASSSRCHEDESTQEGRGKRRRIQEDQEGIQKISDALYRFHEPKLPKSATVDIFFFHGLQCEGAHVRDAHILTWRSTAETREKEEIWPQKWLPEDFPQARIISVCYDCSSKQTDTEGRMDLYLIGENLLQEILRVRKHCYDRPVVLVGHGFGGVVIKRLCIHAQDKKEKATSGRDMDMFLESIRGFFFYATPHLGVEGIKPLAENEGPLLRWMRVLNPESARLHEDFSQMWRARRYRWTIYGLGGLESTLERHGLRVPEASTHFGDDYITVQEEHFSVCRPYGKTDNRYQHLHSLIGDVQRQVELEMEPPLVVPDVTVGVEGLLTEILGKHIRDHKFVGFFGMGGVAKTTLAKLIFNRIFARFEFSCFVQEIKQIPGTRDEVKKKVWEKMFRHGVPVCSASGSSGAGGWHQVRGRSLLVVFDDVQDLDHVELLKEIAHNPNEESRFIMTSRDMNRLRDCGHDIHICPLDRLEGEHANKLFISYAFPGRQEPPESLRLVVKQVVDGCEGLPLTLEVLGNYLRGKETEHWEEIPRALRECDKVADLDQKVWAKLQLSYERLPEDEVKNMFLDIASFFVFSEVHHTFSVDDAISAWSSIYGSGRNRLQTLEDRALVKIINRGKDSMGYDLSSFYMHEHLRKMGQRIAKLKGRSFDLSRVRTLSTSDSDSGAKVHNRYPYDDQFIFQGDQELGRIVAHRVRISRISMQVCGQTCAFCIMREVWPMLTAIRYMELQVNISGCCQECRNRGCPLPNTLVLFSLVLLKHGDFVISGGDGTNFQDDTTGTAAGTVMLVGCTSLVKLRLWMCKNIDLGGLNKLRHLSVLEIGWCRSIRNWPTSLRELTNLKRLELWNIGEPFELPITFGNLTNLEHLSIKWCKVTSVPSSLQNLTSLRILEVHVIGTEAIPNVIRFLRHLQILKLECYGIVNLLDGFRELTALRRLSLTCKGILELPDTLGNLTNLEELELRCPISCLPASFSNLTRLKMLVLDGRFGSVKYLRLECFVRLREDKIVCPIFPLFHHLQGFMAKWKSLNLECQHGTSAVIVRNVIGLESLKLNVTGPEAGPDIFGHLQKLRFFKLTCGAMENSLVESLERLSSLEELNVHCRTVERLPDVFGCFSTLKTMRIECPSLQALPDTFGNFIQLSTVHITASGLLRLPDSFAQLSQLRVFQLTGCNTLTISHPRDHVQHLPETIWQMSHLESLLLRNLPQLMALPEALGNLHSLPKLKFYSCAIESLPESLGRLSALTHLGVRGCGNLKALPEALGNLHSLQRLELQSCGIESLPESLGRLSALTHLEINGCGNKWLWLELDSCGIESLPESLGRLSALTHLGIRGYGNLKMLPDTIRGLSSLGSLVLHNLTTPPEALENLHSLQKLELRGCTIENLPENLDRLSGLTDLQIEKCYNVKTLPETIGGLSSLTNLSLVYNSALDSLPESLGRLSCLTKLNLRDCTSLKTLPDTIGGLSSLTSLSLAHNSSLRSLPESLGRLSCLTTLELQDCTSLKTLPETIGGLSSLEFLNISGSGLHSLPNTFWDLLNLRLLYVERCENLKLPLDRSI